MNDTRLHSALARYTHRQTDHWAEQLIVALRNTASITTDDSFRIFRDTLGTPHDAQIKTALDAIPLKNHPSQR